jgi:dTDP-4-dehydrorhamnose 3,5-epimerase
MHIRPTALPGCFILRVHHQPDERGHFTKLFDRAQFARQGLAAAFEEQYTTVSHRGVVRGLHFQSPPMDYTKLVGCVHGDAFDAIVDLRKGSPTYRRHATFHLTASAGEVLYLPRGIAHGFCALSADCVMVYSCTAGHAPACDTGILWSSAGISWPIDRHRLSERDRSLPALQHFDSPFTYEPPAPDGGERQQP